MIRQLKDIKYLKKNGCVSCHGDQLEGGAGAPTLIDTGLSAEEIAKIAKDGKSGKMPAGMFKGTDEELNKAI